MHVHSAYLESAPGGRFSEALIDIETIPGKFGIFSFHKAILVFSALAPGLTVLKKAFQDFNESLLAHDRYIIGDVVHLLFAVDVLCY